MADLKFVGEMLNKAMATALYGPGGDPDASHLEAAAQVFKAMDTLGIEIEDRDGIEGQLREHNNCGDFLEGWPTKE